MSNHTKGEWTEGVSLWKGIEVFTVVDAANPKKIIAVCGVTGAQDEEESIANTRLIAQAKNMLAVLKELQESAAYWSEYDVPLGIVDRINQAIAKAEQS